jgi:hypothetical protein
MMSKVHYDDPQVFNHLVKQFNFMLRNEPETIIEGRNGTKGSVEYIFKTFGAITILCIEMKLKIGNDAERLDAISQAIAECFGYALRLLFLLPTY